MQTRIIQRKNEQLFYPYSEFQAMQMQHKSLPIRLKPEITDYLSRVPSFIAVQINLWVCLCFQSEACQEPPTDTAATQA